MNTKLYIGNLSPVVSEADLHRVFSQAGAVTEVTIALDPATRQPRGFGYVTMATPELAATALKDFHCYNLGGRYITVTEARPPQEEPKGRMSEGFGLGASAPFRPAPQANKGRRRFPRSSRPRNRGR